MCPGCCSAFEGKCVQFPSWLGGAKLNLDTHQLRANSSSAHSLASLVTRSLAQFRLVAQSCNTSLGGDTDFDTEPVDGRRQFQIITNSMGERSSDQWLMVHKPLTPVQKLSEGPLYRVERTPEFVNQLTAFFGLGEFEGGPSAVKKKTSTSSRSLSKCASAREKRRYPNPPTNEPPH